MPEGKRKQFRPLWECALLLLVSALAAGALWLLSPVMTLRLSYQKTGEVILTQPVRAGDQITVELTHSFEHVAWNEYFFVQADGTFLLDRIEVGGYGAGIPASMEVETYVGEDGLVHMNGINSVFPRFNWITSQVNMKDLQLNGQTILYFADLPHHSFVTCEIEIQRRLFRLV